MSERGVNITQMAYQRLRADILACRLRPSDRLVISDLCERLGASLGAVREALSRLTSEGLVTSEPNKGFRVSSITQQELEDLTRVRGIIEGLCLASAIEAGDLKWETGIVSSRYELQHVPLHNPKDPERINDDWTSAHARFHAALVSACDSPWLLRLRETLYVQSERYRQLSVPLARRKRDLNTEHQAIADAALARNAELAKRLMVEHIGKTTRILLEAKVVELMPPAESESAA
jgi:DNA-binding GntR family transcriptional regulator